MSRVSEKMAEFNRQSTRLLKIFGQTTGIEDLWANLLIFVKSFTSAIEEARKKKDEEETRRRYTMVFPKTQSSILPQMVTPQPQPVHTEADIRDSEWEQKILAKFDMVNENDENEEDIDDEDLYLDYVRGYDSISTPTPSHPTEHPTEQPVEEPPSHTDPEPEIPPPPPSIVLAVSEPDYDPSAEPTPPPPPFDDQKEQQHSDTEEDTEKGGVMDRLLSAVTDGYYFWKE